MSEKRIIPEWTTTPPLPGSYRAITKQGRMDEIKLPSERYYNLLKSELKVDDSYFSGKRNDGNMPVHLDAEINVSGDVVDALVKISGAENVQNDSYNRIKYSHGKLQEEMFNLKRGVVHETTGVVVHPRDKKASCRRLIETPDEIQQRRLTAPGGTDEGDKRSRLNVETSPFESLDRDFSRLVFFGDVLCHD